MSKENLGQFIQRISDSEELQAQLSEEMGTDAFIALGAEQGCDFSVKDLAAGSIITGTELSDEELDGLAGGGFGEVLAEWMLEKADQTVEFYAGLAGGLAGGSDFAKAAHDAGKSAGIIGRGSRRTSE